MKDNTHPEGKHTYASKIWLL